MESITDCAFSWPISASLSVRKAVFLRREGVALRTSAYVGSSLGRSARGFDRCCVLFGRTWSHA